VRAIP